MVKYLLDRVGSGQPQVGPGRAKSEALALDPMRAGPEHQKFGPALPADSVSPPPPVEVEGELEYEIAEVVDSKLDKQQFCKLLYLVCWLGYENTDDEFSWLPATELEHAKELISDFHSAFPNKPGPLSKLK